MKSYTVKVPVQWAGVNSARAQTYLRDRLEAEENGAGQAAGDPTADFVGAGGLEAEARVGLAEAGAELGAEAALGRQAGGVSAGPLPISACERRCLTTRARVQCDRLPLAGQNFCGICYENERFGLCVLWNGSLGRRGVALTGPWRYTSEGDGDGQRLAGEVAPAASGASARTAAEQAEELVEECPPQLQRLTRSEMRELARQRQKAARDQAEEIAAMCGRGKISEAGALDLIRVGKTVEKSLRQFARVNPEEAGQVRGVLKFRELVLEEFEKLKSSALAKAMEAPAEQSPPNDGAVVAA